MKPESMKELVDLAARLSENDIKALRLLRDAKRPLSSIHIASKLMLTPSEVDSSLVQLQDNALIVSRSPSERDYVTKEHEEYFILSDSGEALSGILDHLA